jgi:hypothetical protein
MMMMLITLEMKLERPSVCVVRSLHSTLGKIEPHDPVA